MPIGNTEQSEAVPAKVIITPETDKRLPSDEAIKTAAEARRKRKQFEKVEGLPPAERKFTR